MAKPKKDARADSSTAATVGYEAQLWQMADALRGSMDAAEYKHVCLGLLFLKYISDAFEEKHAALLAEKAQGADLVVRNRALHRHLVDGVTAEYRDAQGSIRGAQARVIDFGDPAGNDWLAVNQFSVVENKHSRRPHGVAKTVCTSVTELMP